VGAGSVAPKAQNHTNDAGSTIGSSNAPKNTVGNFRGRLSLRAGDAAQRVVPEGAAVVWLTSESPQARLLAGEDEIVFAPHAAQRDVRNVLLILPAAMRALLGYRPTAVVSTGASTALAALPAARISGVEAHCVESAARTDGPSLTGRLLRRLPGAHCYTQWEPWATRGLPL
jgi:UDP-N-acetylglucosamine--N-acetylmuramyl-(pentapeptide) pyrophosphoryl-undecaprenol N-acetylglucosamine transferase